MTEVVIGVVAVVISLLAGCLGYFMATKIAASKVAALVLQTDEVRQRLALSEAELLTTREAVHAARSEALIAKGDVDKFSALLESVEAQLEDARVTHTRLSSSLDEIRQEAQSARESSVKLTGELRTAERVLEEREESHENRVQAILEAEQKMSDHFSTLSSKALSDSTEELMKRAKDVLDTYKLSADAETMARKEEMEKLVDPLKKQLDELDQLHTDLERRRSNEVGQLSKQLEDLMRNGDDLRKQTLTLTKALHNPGQAGSWGEMVLERIIEMSGLTEGVTYISQESIKGSDVTGRPDVSIRMPGNKVVFIDSKAPLKHYLEAIDTEDDNLRHAGLQTFAQKVDEHVRALAKRKYSDVDEAVDFTVLFLPSEAAYRVAIETRPRLIEDSFALKVVIATPSSLFAMLKTIHYAWRHDRLAEDAAEVRKVGAQLYANISKLADHYRRLGKGLNQAVDAYNGFGSSLESRTLPSARKLHALGVSDTEPIPQFDAVAATTYVLTRPEFGNEAPPDEPIQRALVESDTGK